MILEQLLSMNLEVAVNCLNIYKWELKKIRLPVPWNASYDWRMAGFLSQLAYLTPQTMILEQLLSADFVVAVDCLKIHSWIFNINKIVPSCLHKPFSWNSPINLWVQIP